jgi:hypothetical protein
VPVSDIIIKDSLKLKSDDAKNVSDVLPPLLAHQAISYYPLNEDCGSSWSLLAKQYLK